MPPDVETAADDGFLSLLAEALDGVDEIRIALMTRLCLISLGIDLEERRVGPNSAESTDSGRRPAKIDKVNGVI